MVFVVHIACPNLSHMETYYCVINEKLLGVLLLVNIKFDELFIHICDAGCEEIEWGSSKKGQNGNLI
jgi:hypothetical protein